MNITKSPKKFLQIFTPLLTVSLIIASICFVFLNKKYFFTKGPYPCNNKTLNHTKISKFGDHGVHVFAHLYANDNQFLISKLPENNKDSFNFLPLANYDYTVSSLSPSFFTQMQSKNRAITFKGNTLILASEQSMKFLQRHYFHFLEEFILGWSALKSIDPNATFDTLIFPDTVHWQYVNDINKKIVELVCPGAKVLNKKKFDKLKKNCLIDFEQAIFIDRMSCHELSEVKTYNKMAIAHAPLIKTDYIRELRDRIYKGLQTNEVKDRQKTITYICRKSRRYLEPAFEKEFLEELQQKFPDCLIQPVAFEKHTYAEQIQIIRNTDVLIGPHGNGLTHAYFLPDNSLVIEIFPQGAFAMDYQLVSELAGHQYYAYDPVIGQISKAHERHRPRGNVNQVISRFDTQDLLDKIDRHFQN